MNNQMFLFGCSYIASGKNGIWKKIILFFKFKIVL